MWNSFSGFKITDLQGWEASETIKQVLDKLSNGLSFGWLTVKLLNIGTHSKQWTPHPKPTTTTINKTFRCQVSHSSGFSLRSGMKRSKATGNWKANYQGNMFPVVRAMVESQQCWLSFLKPMLECSAVVVRCLSQRWWELTSPVLQSQCRGQTW